MFGVPGDFNLRFLVSDHVTTKSSVLSELQDHVEDFPGINWVGNWSAFK
jgi:TPP-dependent 2-oxoacid decarboxylase